MITTILASLVMGQANTVSLAFTRLVGDKVELCIYNRGRITKLASTTVHVDREEGYRGDEFLSGYFALAASPDKKRFLSLAYVSTGAANYMVTIRVFSSAGKELGQKRMTAKKPQWFDQYWIFGFDDANRTIGISRPGSEREWDVWDAATGTTRRVSQAGLPKTYDEYLIANSGVATPNWAGVTGWWAEPSPGGSEGVAFAKGFSVGKAFRFARWGEYFQERKDSKGEWNEYMPATLKLKPQFEFLCSLELINETHAVGIAGVPAANGIEDRPYANTKAIYVDLSTGVVTPICEAVTAVVISEPSQ